MSCRFCYDMLSLMQELGDPELRERFGAAYNDLCPDRHYELRQVYDELADAIITQLGIWASFGPRKDMTVGLAGLADALHSAIHRVLFRHAYEIIAVARIEVNARSREYGARPAEVKDRIRDLMDYVLDYVEDIARGEQERHSS